MLYGLGIAGPKDDSENPEGRELVLALKGMTAHFSHSVKATGDLQAMQKQLGLRKTLRMVRPGATQWNGVHDMATRSNTLEWPLRQLASGIVPKSRLPSSEAAAAAAGGDDAGTSKLSSSQVMLDHPSDSADNDDEEVLQSSGDDPEEGNGEDVVFSEGDDTADWCLDTASWKLSRQFEACLVLAHETTDILQGDGIITGQILLTHKTMVDIYETGGDCNLDVPRSASNSLVGGKEREWKGMKVSRLEKPAQVLRKVIGKQLRKRWYGKPTNLVKQPEAFELAAFLDKSVPNSSVFTQSDLARVRSNYERKIKALIVRSGGDPKAGKTQQTEEEAPLAHRLTMKERLTQQMTGSDSPARNSTRGGGSTETAAACETRLWNSIPMRSGESILESIQGQDGINAHTALTCSVFAAHWSEAGSERVFSHAGRLLSSLRESMGAEMAETFIFLHENIHFWPSTKEIMKEFWATHYPGQEVPFEHLN